MIFRLTILGSNSAIPVRDRLPTSQVLHIGNEMLMIDCGEGTQMQMRRYRISMQRIRNIFISHLHGDHFYGLIGLLSTNNLLGRTKEMHVYGDPRLEEIISRQFEVSETNLNYPLHFHPIDPEEDGVIMETERYEVETFPLDHRIPTHGFIFREKKSRPRILAHKLKHVNVPNEAWERIGEGEDFIDERGIVWSNSVLVKQAPPPRSYAFVSDTKFQPSIAERVKGVDLLYHEATFLKDKTAVAAEKFHSTAEQAAMAAKIADVEKLIIGHFSARYKDLEPLLEEARAVFPSSYVGKEGDVFELELKK